LKKLIGEQAVACAGTHKGKCDQNLAPQENLSRLKAWNECAKARKNLADKCYNGGDPTHKDEIAKHYRVVWECLDIIKKQGGSVTPGGGSPTTQPNPGTQLPGGTVIVPHSH
jgi:hypothetical protein